MNSIYETQTEIQQNTELQHFILQTFRLQSKKKRVRKKLFKQVVSQENLLKEVMKEFRQEEEMSGEETSISLSSLPVTTLLKIGKEFFKENESVRFYYNKNKPEQYKNKELLIESLTVNYQLTSKETKKKINLYL